MRSRSVLLLVLASMLAVLALPVRAQQVTPGSPAATASPAAGGSDPSGAVAGPVARGVFFFSRTCPHCELVISDHLPGIFASFGGDPTVSIDESIAPADVAFYLMSNGTLQLLMVDVGVDPGARMFVSDSERLGIDQSVPRIEIAGQSLVGSVDIPGRLPEIIESGLAGEGIDWPPVPGLAAALAPFPDAGDVPGTNAAGRGTEAQLPGAGLPVWERVTRDPLGNGIAILTLVLLLLSLVAVPLRAGRGRLPVLPTSLVPLLAILGIAVSAYLGSVEASGVDAVCGPVGDCNAVQQSEYAIFLGVHIGVLGVIGYALLLAGWALARLLQGRSADLVLAGLAVGAYAGTLFSAWLTYLEPFVIGATCMWCIASALAMLGLLWATAAPGWEAWARLRAGAARMQRA